MSIKQLRAAIAPCCGLGANRAEVDAALNNVSAQLSTQEQLLVETLNILEHSLKAIRLDAVTEELLQNHYNAIKAIREHFESSELPRETADQSDGPYSLEFVVTMSVPDYDEIERMISESWNQAALTHLPCLDIITEFNDDALQTNSTNLCQSTSSVVVPVEKDEEIKFNEHYLLNIIVDSVTIPWDAAQSIKSIERRVQAAIQQRDFVRAGRLDNVSVAIRNVHNHCQELLNATR
ncbi:hypothetical protein [Vibrio parahaemolyticus]|uniref:hypothetical protein n=1 Tax=Vibrio parahaemolyticus TaxID=670 RepID=UPI0004DF7461|nr:hypothetical protein [Vibrio parahaemolyticus]